MKTRFAAGLLVSLLAVSIAVATVAACDTRTPGYWKNHYPESWPSSATITYTDQASTKDGLPPHEESYSWTLPGGSLVDALAILNMPVKGDARINLEQKVIAALLSIAADQRDGWAWGPNFEGGPMDGATMCELIDAAVALLDANPGEWKPSTVDPAVRAQGLALAGAIDYWLNFYDVD